MMSAPEFFDVFRQGLWTASVAAAPVLGVALIVGLAIGLFQALTSVQEMTLTFVPKLIAIVAVFWIYMGFMTQTLVGFFHTTIIPKIIGG